MSVITMFIFLLLPALLIIAIVLAVRSGRNNYMPNKNDAKYAFYYLLSLVSLIFTAISTGMVVFGIINKTIPDAINNYAPSVDSALKFAISALLIAAPIFYFISVHIYRGIHRGDLEKDSGLRRWLTYFILLVTSLIILGVFIGVINNFLSGELTSRFALKALTVFVISGLAFSFYFYDIKRTDPDQPDRVVKIFFYGTMVLVLAAFVSAWFFVESPKTARARRLDQNLVQNIYNIESAVNTYYDRNGHLPQTLDDLQAGNGAYIDRNSLVDPETKSPIIYQKNGDKDFSLCATFRTSSYDNNNGQTAPYTGDAYSKEHNAGYQCLRGNLYAIPAKSAN